MEIVGDAVGQQGEDRRIGLFPEHLPGLEVAAGDPLVERVVV